MHDCGNGTSVAGVDTNPPAGVQLRLGAQVRLLQQQPHTTRVARCLHVHVKWLPGIMYGNVAKLQGFYIGVCGVPAAHQGRLPSVLHVVFACTAFRDEQQQQQ